MRYKTINGTDEKTSLLGMGCMRFPMNPDHSINYEKSEELIDYAYANGVNYFDTAYIYNDGESEAVTGRALAKYPRGSYYLATKLPPDQCGSEKDVYDLFNIQLERCGVDYFDFYLFHHLCDHTYDIYERGYILPALLKLKAEGKIRRLGFSAHCQAPLLKKFLDAFDWDFVQLQINYFDWNYQNMREQYELVEKTGKPLIVMEPVRGGRLAELCPEADSLLKSVAPDQSVASWALRWVSELSAVQVILSGMSTMDQVVDNVKTMSETNPLTAADKETLAQAVDIFKNHFVVPCTKCNYCSGCPAGLDIPRLLQYRNHSSLTLGFFALLDAFRLPEDKRPDKCIKCGQCSEKCPQGIDIPAELETLAVAMANDEFHNEDPAGSAFSSVFDKE